MSPKRSSTYRPALEALEDRLALSSVRAPHASPPPHPPINHNPPIIFNPMQQWTTGYVIPNFTPSPPVDLSTNLHFYGQQVDLNHLTMKIVTIQGQPFTFGTF
jgi:hypothetical protein